MSDIDFTSLSDAVSGWGLFMLIPLFLIRQFLKKPKRHEALMAEMGKRGM